MNGLVAQLGAEIDPGVDAVSVDGEPVARAERVYVLLNKPKGLVTSVKDEDGLDSLTTCLRGLDARVFPVGRLDMDIEGALLLTNDGELAYRLSSPDHPIERVYIAHLGGIMDEATAHRISNGILVEDGVTARARTLILHTGVDTSVVRFTVHEGQKRRIRQLCAMVGHPVQELRRVSEAGLRLERLEPGQWRHLIEGEVAGLRRQVNLT